MGRFHVHAESGRMRRASSSSRRRLSIAPARCRKLYATLIRAVDKESELRRALSDSRALSRRISQGTCCKPCSLLPGSSRAWLRGFAHTFPTSCPVFPCNHQRNRRLRAQAWPSGSCVTARKPCRRQSIIEATLWVTGGVDQVSSALLLRILARGSLRADLCKFVYFPVRLLRVM